MCFSRMLMLDKYRHGSSQFIGRMEVTLLQNALTDNAKLKFLKILFALSGLFAMLFRVVAGEKVAFVFIEIQSGVFREPHDI